MNPLVRHFLDNFARSIAHASVAEFSVACDTAVTWALALPPRTRAGLLMFAEEVTRRVREKEKDNG